MMAAEPAEPPAVCQDRRVVLAAGQLSSECDTQAC